MFRSNYNFNEWLRFAFEYRYQRSGENVYAEDGTLIKNVGGDIALSHGYVLETDRAYFLDGDRINNNFFSLGLRVEPIRDFIFDISYNYSNQQNIAMNTSEKLYYALLKFTLEY
jgi:hypothetical protein